jgi:hypothetical protein
MAWQVRFRIVDHPEIERALGIADEVGDAVIADGDSEILRRHVFELVRFVNDRVMAIGNHFAVGALTHRGISAEQVMVHDHEIRLSGLLPHLGHIAVAILRTFLAQARFRLRRHVVPQR